VRQLAMQVSQIIDKSSERRRREGLNRRITALSAKLDRMSRPFEGRARERAFKLVAKIKRLEADLRQPMLPL